jgi:hypothetical protein
MPITKEDLENAKQDDRARKEKETRKKAEREEKESNEAPRKEVSEFGRKIIGGIYAVPSALAGAALLGSQPDVPVTSAAKLGARIGYNTVTQDKKALAEAGKEFENDVKQAKTVKRKRDTGENTNPAGDTYKKGGKVKSASARADGCAIRGKTRA